MYSINGESTSNFTVFCKRLEEVRESIGDKDNVLNKVFNQMLGLSSYISLYDANSFAQLDIEYVFGDSEEEGYIRIKFDKYPGKWSICVDGPLSSLCTDASWYRQDDNDIVSYQTDSSTALLRLLKEGLKNLINHKY